MTLAIDVPVGTRDQIVITPAAGLESLVTGAPAPVVFELEPDGLRFDDPLPIKLSMPLASTRTGDEVMLPIILTRTGEGRIETLPSLSVLIDTSNDEVTVRGQVNHFSSLAVIFDGTIRVTINDLLGREFALGDSIPVMADTAVVLGWIPIVWEGEPAFASFPYGFDEDGSTRTVWRDASPSRAAGAWFRPGTMNATGSAQLTSGGTEVGSIDLGIGWQPLVDFAATARARCTTAGAAEIVWNSSFRGTIVIVREDPGSGSYIDEILRDPYEHLNDYDVDVRVTTGMFDCVAEEQARATPEGERQPDPGDEPPLPGASFDPAAVFFPPQAEDVPPELNDARANGDWEFEIDPDAWGPPAVGETVIGDEIGVPDDTDTATGLDSAELTRVAAEQASAAAVVGGLNLSAADESCLLASLEQGTDLPELEKLATGAQDWDDEAIAALAAATDACRSIRDFYASQFGSFGLNAPTVQCLTDLAVDSMTWERIYRHARALALQEVAADELQESFNAEVEQFYVACAGL